MKLLSMVLGAMALSTGLVACDDEPMSGSYPLPECPDLVAAPCDTRATACQKRLLELAACMYGVDHTPDVPIRVVTEDELIAELSAPESGGSPRSNSSAGGAGGAPGAGGAGGTDAGGEAAANEGADDDAASLPDFERALVALGLAQPGALTTSATTEELVNQVDGVYQNAERGIALVDRGTAKDSPEATAVLVHELIHAIQDEKYDLAAWQKRYVHDIDSDLAVHSVSEGQATDVQFRLLFAMLGYDLSTLDVTPRLEDFRDSLFQRAEDDDSPYVAASTTFPYGAGVLTAASAWSPNGLHFPPSQFENPPITTAKVLADSYGVESETGAPYELDPPGDDADYARVKTTRLGAFMFELFLVKLGVELPTARTLAFNLASDELWVYRAGDGSTAFLWELELEPTSLDGIAQANALTSGAVLEYSGQRVFVAGTSAPPDFILAAGRRFIGSSP